jgi:hypothetical protein
MTYSQRIEIILVTALIVAALAFGLRAMATPTAPDFHTCANLTSTGDGDKAHFEAGLHQIAGNGLVEGADDVYSANGGNAVQCFCPKAGTGIQTNWWKTTEQQGGSGTWINIGNGVQWNLENANYVAKNIDWVCNVVTPRPTPSDELPVTGMKFW